MKGRLVARSAVDSRLRAEMYALLREHFDGASEAQFARDLDEKNWVVLLEDEHAVLRGFSTILLYRTSFCGEDLDVVCSGDTIVHPEVWASPALASSWISSVLRLQRERGRCARMLWLLICSGHRTYRFMPVFMREFFPRHGVPTPARTAALMASLARERFGPLYDATRGLVVFERPQRLIAQLAHVPELRRRNPHVAFFLEHNPDYARGDELVCLAELSRANLTSAGKRMLELGDRTCDNSAADTVPAE